MIPLVMINNQWHLADDSWKPLCGITGSMQARTQGLPVSVSCLKCRPKKLYRLHNHLWEHGILVIARSESEAIDRLREGEERIHPEPVWDVTLIEETNMRYMLNGLVEVNKEKYWRVDDMERMFQEERSGTFNPIKNMQRFGIAINSHNVTHEQASKMVELLNKFCDSTTLEAGRVVNKIK